MLQAVGHKRKPAAKALMAFAVMVLMIWTIGPLMWSFAASVKTPPDVYLPQLIPTDPTLDAYVNVFGLRLFTTHFRNSLMLAIISTILAVIPSAFAAYAFSRWAFRYRHLLLLLILIPRLVPRVSLIVPLYMLLLQVGLLDTWGALVITYAASNIPLATWILVGFFGGVPKELEEAAAIDGASVRQILQKITLPLAVPGLITVSVLSFRDSWNEFPFVLAFTSSPEQRTLPYALFLLRDTLHFQDWPTINAFALLSIIPILVGYLFFEKYVVSGLTSGALK